MNARDAEAALLSRCVSVARDEPHAAACDGKDANVFRLAAMVVQSRFPNASQRLMQASNAYFAQHSGERLPPENVVQRGWIVSLPRLRDMLSRQLGGD